MSHEEGQQSLETLELSESKVHWFTDRFSNLPFSKADILNAVIVSSPDDLSINGIKATTQPHMGREAGWDTVFENDSGEKFTWLGIKGVGLTKKGRKRFRDFDFPQAFDEMKSGFPPTKAADVYDLDTPKRFVPPHRPGEDVLGFVGLKEVQNDQKIATKLIEEGFLTAEPIAVIEGDPDDPEITQLKEGNFVDKNVKEGREIRALRIPRRLRTIKHLIREKDNPGLKRELEFAVKKCQQLGVDLEKYGGKNPYQNYLIWLYQQAGKQAGIAARETLKKRDLYLLGDITYAFEIVDLGQHTQLHTIKETKPSEGVSYSPKASFANDIYEDYAQFPFVVFAAVKLSGFIKNSENLDVITQMASQFHSSFIKEYLKKDKDKALQDLINYLDREGAPIWSTWFKPHIVKQHQRVSPEFIYASGYLSEGEDSWKDLPENCEWPKGNKVKFMHYSDVLRYALGQQLLQMINIQKSL